MQISRGADICTRVGAKGKSVFECMCVITFCVRQTRERKMCVCNNNSSFKCTLHLHLRNNEFLLLRRVSMVTITSAVMFWFFLLVCVASVADILHRDGSSKRRGFS